MQSARCCIVILLRHGLAQKNLHAGDAGQGCGDGKLRMIEPRELADENSIDHRLEIPLV